MTTAATPAEIAARNATTQDAVSQLAFATRRLFAAESATLSASLVQGAGWNCLQPMNTSRIASALDAAEAAIASWQKRCPVVAATSNAVALLAQTRAARRTVVGTSLSLAAVGIEARV
jgi:hypothetical protein